MIDLITFYFKFFIILWILDLFLFVIYYTVIYIHRIRYKIRRNYNVSDRDFTENCKKLADGDYSEFGVFHGKLYNFRNGELIELRKALAITGYKLELIKVSETDLDNTEMSNEEFRFKIGDIKNNFPKEQPNDSPIPK